MTFHQSPGAHQGSNRNGERASRSGREPGLLTKYEGVFVVVVFMAVCSAFVGWLMLPEHWRAVTAWIGMVLICVVGIVASWPKRVR